MMVCALVFLERESKADYVRGNTVAALYLYGSSTSVVVPSQPAT